MSANRTALIAVYYAAAFALILVGVSLWVTGHGTGDPYLTLGCVLALVPITVIWVRRLFGRD